MASTRARSLYVTLKEEAGFEPQIFYCEPTEAVLDALVGAGGADATTAALSINNHRFEATNLPTDSVLGSQLMHRGLLERLKQQVAANGIDLSTHEVVGGHQRLRVSNLANWLGPNDLKPYATFKARDLEGMGLPRETVQQRAPASGLHVDTINRDLYNGLKNRHQQDNIAVLLTCAAAKDGELVPVTLACEWAGKSKRAYAEIMPGGTVVMMGTAAFKVRHQVCIVPGSVALRVRTLMVPRLNQAGAAHLVPVATDAMQG
ncbi:hypothetical protein HT031_004187 [Scenedesmus sp. PABB004]|nr:hypothetical protein HT031_004187 [Scenedesmus sp. PABB004]